MNGLKVHAIFLLLFYACGRYQPQTLPFTGPIFSHQNVHDSLCWQHFEDDQTFEYYQAESYPAFLYEEVAGDFSLQCMLPVPVRSGGLSVHQMGRSWHLLAEMDTIFLQASDTSGLESIILNDNAYPIRLGLFREGSMLTARCIPSQQAPVTVARIPISGNELQAGLSVQGFGGFHFQNVDLTTTRTPRGYRLEILDVFTLQRKALFSNAAPISSPFPTSGGEIIYYIQKDQLKRFLLEGETHVTIPVDLADSLVSVSVEPGGTRIALTVQNTKGDHGIFWADNDGNRVQRYYSRFPVQFCDWHPSKSAFLVETTRFNQQPDLYEMSMESRREQPIANDPGNEAGGTYAESDQAVYFHADYSNQMKIWKYGRQDEILTQITSDEWEDRFPLLSPDGRWLLMHSMKLTEQAGNSRHQLRLLDLQDPGAAPFVLMPWPGELRPPTARWMPDGRSIVAIQSTSLSL